MLGNMARGEALAPRDTVAARELGQRGGNFLRDERGTRAMLRAGAAINLVAIMGMRRGRVFMLAVVVVGLQLHRACVPAGGANADRDGRKAAQRNQREHRGNQQQLESAFHGPGC